MLKPKARYRPLPEDMNDPLISTSHPHPNLKLFENYIAREEDARLRTNVGGMLINNQTNRISQTQREVELTGAVPRITPPIFAKGTHVVPPNRVQNVIEEEPMNTNWRKSKKGYGSFYEEKTNNEVTSDKNGRHSRPFINPLKSQPNKHIPLGSLPPNFNFKAGHNPLQQSFTPGGIRPPPRTAITVIPVPAASKPRKSNYIDFLQL